MENETFVKIEDKKMPLDNYSDFEVREKSFNAGFVSFTYLLAGVVTFVMWIMLLFFRK